MKSLIISKPCIVELGKKVLLQADIISEKFNKPYFFEVESKYADYLCEQRADAFVLGLLYFAMVNGYNIKCEAPMSEKLFYQLTQTPSASS